MDISISSIDPQTLHKSGGQTVKITGAFFPESLTEAKSFEDFSVKFTGGGVCTVTSVSKTEIICTSPPNLPTGAKITVTFNTKSKEHTTAFTVNASTESVVSVDKPAICPVLKQDIKITVSKADNTNPSAYTAVLVHDSTSIYMRVNSVNTSTKTLTARFPGSPLNTEYYVYVEYNNERYSSNVKVNAKSQIDSYEIITTAPVAKSEISTTGGDRVKITGTGFSTNLQDNVVQFGNVYADVLQATQTELIVRAGPSSVKGSVEIKVFLKMSIESACEIASGCKITYTDTGVPTLDSPTTYLVPINGVITIKGTNFGVNPIGYIGLHAQETVSATATEIKIKLIKIEDDESVTMIVRTDTINLPTIYIAVPIQPALTGVAPKVGSSGGEKLILSTVGLGLSVTSDLNIYYGSGTSAVNI